MSNQLASAIGIDMGTSRSVIAAAIRGGVEILANEGSFRETPNTVVFGDVQRFLGNEGVSKKKGNFKSTLEFFSRFLGMNSESPDLAAEKAHVYCPTAFNEAGRLIFKPRYQGEQIEILPEQALATMLTKLRHVLELNNITNKDVVMSVPSYYTQVERKLALLAGRIAGLNIIKLMNESTATVLNYGIFRKKDLSDDPRLVAFVDVGNSKTSITFAKVKKMGAEIVLEKTDRNLGGRDFDLLLFKEYQKRFEKKENMDLYEYPKSKMRLLDAIEKQRKTLSANGEAPINVEYLCEDIDFADVMTRDEFEKLCAPLLAKFGVLIKECFTEAGFTTKEFHSVEVIGGCTRTPALQQMIQQTFAIDEVSRTLNQSESIARGCAIQAAIKSPLFQVAEYTIPERNVSKINCKYSVEKLGEGGIFETKEYNNVLFKKNCEFPTVMTISVSKATKASLQLSYEEENPVHSQQMLVDVETKPYKIKEDEYKILLKGKIDDNGIIGLKCVELEETYLEEVKTLIKKKPETKAEETKREEAKKAEAKKTEEANGKTTAPVDGETKPAEGETEKPAEEAQSKDKMEEEPEYKLEMKKRSRFTEVKFVDNIKGVVDGKDQLEALLAIEGRMCMKDKLVKETLVTKNNLESFIYESRDRLVADFKNYATKSEAEAISTLAQKSEDWLYDAGQSVSKDEYLIKLGDLQKVVNPVKSRLDEYLQLRDMLNHAHQRFTYYTNEIPNNAEKYSHLLPADQDEILAGVNVGVELFKQAQSKLANTELSKSPPVKFEDLKSELYKIEQACDKILSTPKPAPPKEEPKVEEPKVEEPKTEDSKMQEENLPSKEDVPQNGEKMDVEN